MEQLAVKDRRVGELIETNSTLADALGDLEVEGDKYRDDWAAAIHERVPIAQFEAVEQERDQLKEDLEHQRSVAWDWASSAEQRRLEVIGLQREHSLCADVRNGLMGELSEAGGYYEASQRALKLKIEELAVKERILGATEHSLKLANDHWLRCEKERDMALADAANWHGAWNAACHDIDKFKKELDLLRNQLNAQRRSLLKANNHLEHERDQLRAEVELANGIIQAKRLEVAHMTDMRDIALTHEEQLKAEVERLKQGEPTP
jgi:hypothetical protein